MFLCDKTKNLLISLQYSKGTFSLLDRSRAAYRMPPGNLFSNFSSASFIIVIISLNLVIITPIHRFVGRVSIFFISQQHLQSSVPNCPIQPLDPPRSVTQSSTHHSVNYPNLFISSSYCPFLCLCQSVVSFLVSVIDLLTSSLAS